MNDMAMNPLWPSLQAKLEEKDAEIERLKEAFDIIADKLVIAETKIRIDHDNALEADELLAAKDAEIERLKALCARAADALEVYLPTAAGGTRHPFIAELRKAAE